MVLSACGTADLISMNEAALNAAMLDIFFNSLSTTDLGCCELGRFRVSLLHVGQATLEGQCQH